MADRGPVYTVPSSPHPLPAGENILQNYSTVSQLALDADKSMFWTFPSIPPIVLSHILFPQVPLPP